MTARPPVESLPYRRNVGIALFGGDGRVLIGRRFRDDGPEIILPGLEWQMPQGGIDEGEEPRIAVMRELWEETGVTGAEILGETDWVSYDFPPYDGPAHRLAVFRGQRQKWFALRFTGQESEIDIHRPGGGQHPAEFAEWRWEKMERICDLVVPFKRDTYASVVAAFQRFAG